MPGIKWLVGMLLSSIVALMSFAGSVLFLNKFLFLTSAVAMLAVVAFFVGFKLDMDKWLKK